MIIIKNSSAPKGYMLQCTIKRDKSGMARFFPVYQMCFSVLFTFYYYIYTFTGPVLEVHPGRQEETLQQDLELHPVLGQIRLQEEVQQLYWEGAFQLHGHWVRHVQQWGQPEESHEFGLHKEAIGDHYLRISNSFVYITLNINRILIFWEPKGQGKWRFWYPKSRRTVKSMSGNRWR